MTLEIFSAVKQATRCQTGFEIKGNATKPDFNIYQPKMAKEKESVNNDLLHIDYSNNEMNGLYAIMGEIAQNAKTLKDVGCIALYGVANKANQKLVNISKSLNNAISGFQNEIKGILKDNSLSEEEKESKIKLILAKKEAAIEEGEAKADALLKISDALSKLVPCFLEMKAMGLDTDEIMEPLIKMINQIDVAPTKLDKAKDADDIKELSKENLKNIFGANSKDFVQNYVKTFDAKIDKLQKKLKNKDLSAEEKEQTQTELNAYKELRTLFVSFFKQVE